MGDKFTKCWGLRCKNACEKSKASQIKDYIIASADFKDDIVETELNE